MHTIPIKTKNKKKKIKKIKGLWNNQQKHIRAHASKFVLPFDEQEQQAQKSASVNDFDNDLLQEDEEIKQIKSKLGEHKTSLSSSYEIAKTILKKSAVKLEELTQKRVLEILVPQIEGVRKIYETKERLYMPFTKGGAQLSEKDIDKIIQAYLDYKHPEQNSNVVKEQKTKKYLLQPATPAVDLREELMPPTPQLIKKDSLKAKKTSQQEISKSSIKHSQRNLDQSKLSSSRQSAPTISDQSKEEKISSSKQPKSFFSKFWPSKKAKKTTKLTKDKKDLTKTYSKSKDQKNNLEQNIKEDLKQLNTSSILQDKEQQSTKENTIKTTSKILKADQQKQSEIKEQAITSLKSDQASKEKKTNKGLEKLDKIIKEDLAIADKGSIDASPDAKSLDKQVADKQNLTQDSKEKIPFVNKEQIFQSDQLHSEPKEMVDTVRPMVKDIERMKSHLIGPLEELKTMTLLDFRRLGRSPKVATQKILQKIDILGEESLKKKLDGISAWRQSEVMQTYLKIGEESLFSGKSIQEIIEQRKSKRQPYLSLEEFNAILELNDLLREF